MVMLIIKKKLILVKKRTTYLSKLQNVFVQNSKPITSFAKLGSFKYALIPEGTVDVNILSVF